MGRMHANSCYNKTFIYGNTVHSTFLSIHFIHILCIYVSDSLFCRTRTCLLLTESIHIHWETQNVYDFVECTTNSFWCFGFAFVIDVEGVKLEIRQTVRHSHKNCQYCDNKLLISEINSTRRLLTAYC